VSTITRFPGPSRPQKTSQEEFEREVAARFGLVPNFFRSAPDAPLVIRELWLFAKSAYLDNPIPTLFKEGSLSISPASAKFVTASRDTAASSWDSVGLPAIQMRQ
jgi:hypothetical protein